MCVFILLILFSPLSVIILCYVLYHLSIPSKVYLEVCIFVCCPHSSTTCDRITDCIKTNSKDSPALHLILRPETRRWLGYLGWMLQNGGLSLTVSEPETPTGLVQEPDTETTKAPEAKHADQSTLGVDMKLIDLWSAYPVPTQVPTLKPLSSSPVPSGFLAAPVPIQRLSSSDVPVGFPGPISSADFSQSHGFVGPTGVVQLLGSASAASSVRLICLASGFLSTRLILCRVPGCTSALQAHVSTSAC